MVGAEPGSTLSAWEPDRGAPTQSAAQLTLVLEAEDPLRPSLRLLMRRGETVSIGRGGERAVSRGPEAIELRVADRRMSAEHARLARGAEGWIVEDLGSKNGTHVNGVPCARAALSDGDVLELGRAFFVFRTAVPVAPDEPDQLAADELEPPAPGLATLVPPLAGQLARLAEVCRAGVPILVQGESGTGKELLARAVHRLSGRSGDLVAVNCGAIPETLVEAELFGYRKGAFSGALEDRPGLIRSAQGGTLFLDEIGDLPAASQAALLRALQQREVTPVGGVRPVTVDVAVVSATHRDLHAQIAAGDMREDLYARVAGFTVALPPLRDRREDLGLLMGALLPRRGASFTAEAARALFRYGWPRNVRELEHALRAAAALAGTGPIDLQHLPDAVTAGPTGRARPAPPSPEPVALDAEDERLRAQLVALLERHKGNVSAVAREMGRQRAQVHRWIRRLRLPAAVYRLGDDAD